MTWWLFKRFLFSKRSGALIRTISWLCVSGIGFGVFSLILVMSIMNGFNRSIKNRLFSAEPHLVVTLADSDQETKWREFRSEFLGNHPEIETSEFEQQDVIVKTADGFFSGALAKGVDSETLTKAFQRLGWGDLSSTVELGENEVVMGMGLGKSLQVFEEDTLTLIKPEGLLLPPGQFPEFVRARVKGFLSTQVSQIDGHQFFYIKGKSLKRFAGASSLRVGVEVFLPDPLKYRSIKQELTSAGFEVESWKDRNSALFQSLMMEKVMIGVFLGLSTVIASFSIITVLILLSAQKQKEFGLMMAMGMSATETKRTFTGLGMCLSGLGMGVGLVCGVVASLVIENYPLNLLPSIYHDTRIPALVDYQFVGAVALGAIAISVLASWYPSGKLAKLLPAAALRGRK